MCVPFAQQASRFFRISEISENSELPDSKKLVKLANTVSFQILQMSEISENSELPDSSKLVKLAKTVSFQILQN